MSDAKYREYFINLLQTKTGIHITEAKTTLFYTKLHRIMRKRNIATYHDYYNLIKNEDNLIELQEFINAFTTNTTEFFREPIHFDYLRHNMFSIINSMPNINANKEIRVWCAASSSGQEPVTLAMVLKETLSNSIAIRLLATDISTKVLIKAGAGLYTEDEAKGIPKYYLHKYFEKTQNGYLVNQEILEIIKYRQFNLTEEFNFKHTFDIIFCRNVMIYFDNTLQQNLIDKFYQHLNDNGLLFIGSSESLINKKHRFTPEGTSIYRK